MGYAIALSHPTRFRVSARVEYLERVGGFWWVDKADPPYAKVI